jgi:ABC-type sulfate transport system substrate-binding protein
MVIIFDHTKTASNQRTFYLSGVNQTNIASTANGGVIYNAQNTNNFGNRIFRMGGRSTTTFSQDMLLSTFRIYNRALTAQEIQQNYNATKSRYGL